MIAVVASLAALSSSASVTWELNGGASGFTASQCATLSTPTAGHLTVSLSCAGGTVILPASSIDADANTVLVLDAVATATGDLEVRFTAGGTEHTLTGPRLQHDGQLHRYTIALREHPAWSGTVTGVKLAFPTTASAKVTIDRLAILRAPWRGTWSFGDGETDGWTATSTVASPTVSDGAFTGTVSLTSATSPRLESRSPLRLPARQWRTLNVTVRASSPTAAQQLRVWWGTSDAPTLNLSRSMTADFAADGTAQTLRFDVFAHAKWHGQIDTIWVQPFVSAEDGATFAIEDVGFGARFEFDEAGDGAGFVGDGGVAGLRVAGGALRGVVTSAEATVSARVDLPAAGYQRILVTGRVDPGDSCAVGVAFEDASGAIVDVPLDATCDGEFHTWVASTEDVAAWTGDVKRLFVTLPGGGEPRRFALERVQVMPSGGSLELARVEVPYPLVVGDALPVVATVENRGADPIAGAKLILGGKIAFPPELGPFESSESTETLGTASSCSQSNLQTVTVSAQFPGPDGLWTQAEPKPVEWIAPLAPVPSEVPPPGSGPSGLVAGDSIFLQNDRVRLTLHRDSCLGGYGYLRLHAAKGGEWHPVGGRVGLARLAFERLDGTVEDVTITNPTAGALQSGEGSLALPLNAAHVDGDGVTWQLSWLLTVKTGSPSIEMTATASPTGKRDLLLFVGPALEVGLGIVDPPPVSGAWFGGVDVLGPGDESSSSRGIVTADANRATPDNKLLTHPAMAVSAGGLTSGIVWTRGASWTTSLIGPSARFLVPNRDAGRSTSLMRLQVPNTPDFVLPGDAMASGPLVMFPGDMVTLSAGLFATAGDSARIAIEAVREREGTASGKSFDDGAVRSLVRQALGATGWTGSGWALEAGQPGEAAADVLAVARALARLDGGATLTATADAAAAQVEAWWSGPRDWVGMEAGWLEGHTIEAIEDGWAALQAADAAGPSAGAPPELLEPEHDGIAGLPRLAWQLLKLARISGIQAARDAGLTRITQLDGVDRPAGGLLHEGIPSAAPDLAFCVDAIMAYLEAWKLTGDADHLARARFFAYTALTFVYPTDVPQVASGYGLYGAVPALGGVDFVDSRFAMASGTQGVRLSLALTALDEADPAEPWDVVAAGLLGAVATRLEPTGTTWTGHYPARYDLRANAPEGGYRLPHLVGRALLERAGAGLQFHTAELENPSGEPVQISALVSLTAQGFDPDDYAVEVEVAASPDGPVILAVGRLTGEPPGVWVDGSPLDEADWRYDADIQVAEVTLPASADARIVGIGFPIPDADGDTYPANLDCDDDEILVHPGAPEICNNVDDDCNGETDEPEDTGFQSCGIGQCEHDEPVCVAGEIVECDPLAGQGTEVCDEIDNDCDGDTDEIEDVGYAECGKGICKREIYACDECEPFIGAEPEVCDTVDNDCDGEIDETPGTVLCGVGKCEHLISVCDPCEPHIGAEEEVCNLIDDDCDGETDEGLPTVPCGTGACLHDIPACAPCNETLGAEAETCNFIDDDCDGQTDEDTPTKTCGQGLCQRQIPTCHECEPNKGAKPEVCNGVDDDCNGVTDDAEGVKPCGTGGCYREIPKCETCEPMEGAFDEVCDGQDNDCDGDTDELTGAAICGLGECAHEVVGCAACSPLTGATDEVCDGLDNDCDGETDEVADLGTFECGVGECARELPSCTGGGETGCDAFEGATDEICDLLDNNCNGTTDEDIGTWICGIGECAHELVGCTEEGQAACDPQKGQSEEICDGLDNDCDGDTDEELGTIECGVALGCPMEVPACVKGVALECHPVTGLAPEICDGIDNDCDAYTDEDQPAIACGVGKCLHTEPGCVDGQPGTCDPMEGASEEVCNFLDDDCDGETDESTPPVTCGEGICQVTVTTCKGGQPEACVPLNIAKPDVCNGLDDDCDGDTDESQGDVTCGEGECQKTIPLCMDGVPQTCEPDGGVPEICNGLDDDCDGATDEDLGTSECGQGKCRRNLPICTNGAPTLCNEFEGADLEVCNGIDDDCNGETDNGLGQLTCPDGAGGTIQKPACVNGQAADCDTPSTDGTDATDGTDGGPGDDATGGSSGGGGAVAPPSEGCQPAGKSHGGAALLLLFALGLVAVIRRVLG